MSDETQPYSLDHLFKTSITGNILEKEIERTTATVRKKVDPSFFSNILSEKEEKKIVEKKAEEVVKRVQKLHSVAEKVAAKKILEGKIDTTKDIASQLADSNNKSAEAIAQRRQNVEELLNLGMTAASIAEALGQKKSTIERDQDIIRKNKKSRNKKVDDVTQAILASYDKMLADLTIEYLNCGNEMMKSKIINSKIRTLESKWKYMFVIGLIKKKKDTSFLGKKDLASMSTAELSNTLKNIQADTQNILNNRANANENDLSFQGKEVGRYYHKAEVEIPDYILDQEDTDLLSEVEDVEAQIKQIENGDFR